MARHRDARPRAPAHLRFVSRVLFPARRRWSGSRWPASRSPRSARRRRSACCRSDCPTCRSTCASTPLSAFFLLLLGAVAAAVSVFSAGYFRASEGTPPGLVCFQYHAFLAAMALVLIADDAYLFMVAWESMALASYFLVTTEHRIPEIRRAGFLYLLIAHVGAIAILLCFGVLQGGSGDYTFAGMRAQHLAGRLAERRVSSSRCSDSAPRRGCCRCTYGCPRPIRPRRRRCPRS